MPIEHVYLSKLDTLSRNDLSMIEGNWLDVVCAADGYPRPTLHISLDENRTIMALANQILSPLIVNDQFQPTAYETYRIIGLTALDNGRNVTCHAQMKQINQNLSRSTTRQLYIQCMLYYFHCHSMENVEKKIMTERIRS